MEKSFFKKKIAVACKDPGAANLIFYLLKYMQPKQVNYYTKNPSSNLFKRNKSKRYSKKTIKDLFRNMDIFICGTGTTDFEKKALIESKKNKIFSFSVIDHYTNYRERFLYKKKYFFPNVILTTSKEAFKKAKTVFPKKKISLIKNYFLFDFQKRIESQKDKKKKYIVYISEPYSNLNLDYEFKSLIYLLKNYDKMKFKSNKIIIKLHPRDKKNKYNQIINVYKKKLKISLNSDIDNVKLLSQAEAIVGLCSYLLEVSSKVGLKTFSCILPYQNQIKRLNQKNIYNLPDRIKI
jgi:glycosyltransferase involved in cell wall biosynthesis